MEKPCPYFISGTASPCGPLSCLPASEKAPDQRAHTVPELAARRPRSARHTFYGGPRPSLSPAPASVLSHGPKEEPFTPLIKGAALLLHAPHPGVPLNLMVSANQHRGAGARLKSLQADLGQDQGFASVERTSETRELYSCSPAAGRGVHLCLVPPSLQNQLETKDAGGLGGTQQSMETAGCYCVAVDGQGDRGGS